MWIVPVGPVNFLPPAAFRSLIRATEHALRPACVTTNAPESCVSAAVLPPACGDRADCRLLLNDAVAEIERLRRQIAGLENSPHDLRPPQACDAVRSIDSTVIDLSKATSARRAYAVAPIGEVRRTQPPTEPPPAPLPRRIIGVVTNLGTLMDVLI